MSNSAGIEATAVEVGGERKFTLRLVGGAHATLVVAFQRLRFAFLFFIF